MAVTVWTAVAVSSPRTDLLEAVGATASLGVSAGVFGILAAHELVHRREPREQALGLTLLALVGYMHFRIAHIHGHHVRAATVRDPTTARRGGSAYRFIGRAVVGQVREAWRFEAARLHRRGERVLGLSNRMLRYGAIELAVAAAFAALGPVAVGFWLGQAGTWRSAPASSCSTTSPTMACSAARARMARWSGSAPGTPGIPPGA